ncbi:RRP15-like protein [Chironomus tepperi]|uniref:RRP15-like protein n=1 Tax=Chironomus tepperi TaxID=113505 RepID=UPI00391F3D00
MAAVESKVVLPETDSESELDEIEDDENRLSDDEEFPISEDEADDEPEDTKKKGWANSMAKILNSEKSEVLSKAKKVEDLEKKKKKKSYTFEIEGEQKVEGEEEKPSEEVLQTALARKKRRERALNLRLKPSVADLDRERTLRKIATKGVVQLFNAVKSQHSDLEQKLQSTKLESKRDEIIRSADNKKHFLDTLMSGPRAKSELVDKRVKKEKKEESSSDEGSNKKSTWSALRDDFMTGKKVGWDKDDDDEESDNIEMESDSE